MRRMVQDWRMHMRTWLLLLLLTSVIDVSASDGSAPADDADDVGPKAMQEEAHRGHASIPSDLRDCRDALAAHTSKQTCAKQFFFRGLPEAAWSAELNAKVLEIAQTKLAMYDAYASEMEQTPAGEAWLQQHRRSFGSRPIRVLTSGNHGVGHLDKKPADTPKHLEY